ncbi:hypothetical protein [Pseudomonas sp. ICMP 460]|uniref:hypothetical protein n=1 Tax=Pseudomonas sp. ICMP 460 TaxID=1718917 RepID=UPI000C067FE7|nr:hypothetical protein [Pseudomonas sp. ICMP 460]PHN32140.1 hypothetical protein AO240_09020 [Pseudomonas sp. ICMP 460]
MSQIKERPILFSAPMVRAILEGRKTVTRRALNAKALKNIGYGVQLGECHELPSEGPLHPNSIGYYTDFCPFGQIGDRLWVRETFATLSAGEYEPVKPHGGRGQNIMYAATDPLADLSISNRGYGYRPSIHMPRWVSRILLEITAVHVERLQDITEDQAKAEGVRRVELINRWFAHDDSENAFGRATGAFRDLWQSVGGDWAANPWVWVVEFKRVTP